MPSHAIDPVCGMKVEKGKPAGTAEHRGRTFYFCGEMCRKRFQEDPEKYASEG